MASVFSDIKIYSWAVVDEDEIKIIKPTSENYYYLNTDTSDKPEKNSDSWSEEKRYIAGTYLWTKVTSEDVEPKIYLIEYTPLSEKASYLMTLTDDVYSYSGDLSEDIIGDTLSKLDALTYLKIYAGIEEVALNSWTFEIIPKDDDGEEFLEVDKTNGAIKWKNNQKSPFNSLTMGSVKRYEIKAIFNDVILYKTFSIILTRDNKSIVINESSIDITDFSNNTEKILEF